MTVTRAGKNLLEPGRGNRTAYGITFTRNADGSVSISGTATAHVVYYFFDYDGTKPSTQFATQFPNGTYIVTGGISNSVYISGFVGDSNQGTRFDDYGNGAEITVTNGSLFGVRIVILNGTTVNTTVYPMIRPASDSNDAYEPYTAQAYPVTWETEAGTVYGGTLDVVSGVLTVDRAIYTGTWAKHPSYNTVFNTDIPQNYLSGQYTDCYCNCLPAQERGTTLASLNNTTQFRASDRLYVSVQNITTLADFRAWVEANELQLCYRLATPQTYQLTPTEVRTLTGFNQIYSDAGPVIDIKF
jgi:hypothetical protein